MILPIWFTIQFFTGVFTASTTKSPALSSNFHSTSNNATCPYRTINYITHVLPQQCLATDRSTYNQEVLVTSQDSPIGTNASESRDHGDGIENASTPVYTTSSTSAEPSASSSSVTSTEIDNSIPKSSVIVLDAPSSTSQAPDDDLALESGSFLSFEEWKKQNLRKAGQSEHVGSGGQAEFPEPRKRPINVQNALDSLGDDAEIDIDFTGFVPGGPDKGVHEATHPIAEVPDGGKNDSPRPAEVRSRSKDAGTTFKERFNYASFDCAANILKTNREAKSSNAILVENKDSYMLNQCAAKDKFIILELCNDIQIDTIVLANFEFFSSTFRTFRVSVSDRYPVKAEKWITLGLYEARNTREVQAFLVENPVIWARYVRLEFLTHYGQEFYCPLSLVRVHGKTMMEEYKHDMVVGTEDENEEEDQTENEEISSIDPMASETIPFATESTSSGGEEVVLHIDPIIVPDLSGSQDIHELNNDIQREASFTNVTPPSIVAYEAISAVIDPSGTCVPKDSPMPTQSEQHNLNMPPVSLSDATMPTINQPKHTPTTTGSDERSLPSSSTASSTSFSMQNVTEEVSPRASKQTKTSVSTTSSGIESSSGLTSTASVAKDRSSKTATERSRQSSVSTQPAPAVPTIQESFFKSVQKRLQMLEANSSLSLQYIEDQSRALRDAFKKVEQRQLAKTTAFLDQLNSTVLNELRAFRQQYDQLWQSTVIELEIQRERYERDNEAINVRLGLLADDMIFQRRMGIVQMVLILLCLVLVLFTRGSINNYLELPLVQNVLSRSPSTKWLSLSNRNSPERPSKLGRSYGAYQSRNGIMKTHRRMQSIDSITDTQSGPEAYIPLTPVSFDAQSDTEFYKEEAKIPSSDFEGDGGFDDPEFDPSLIERPSTSPPVLRVNDLPPIADIIHTSDEEADTTQPTNEIPELTSEMSNHRVLEQPQPDGLSLPAKHLTWDIPMT